MEKKQRSALSHLLFPPRCAVCGEVAPIGLVACDGCIEQLLDAFASIDRCPICQKPRESCICRANPPFFSRCLSCFLYTKQSAPLFSLLKAGDQAAMALLASLMADCWRKADLSAFDSLAFVPSAVGRYSQAEALSLHLSDLLDVKILPTPLWRHQNSRIQHTLSFGERQKNAEASYDRYGGILVAGRVLLIDDVITTGATLSRCAQLLLLAGAREVLCLTAATTPIHYDDTTLQEQGGLFYAFE